MNNPFHPFTPPFRYAMESMHILDANGLHVIDMLGCDERQQRFIPNEDQDNTGQLVAQLMNEHAIKEGM